MKTFIADQYQKIKDFYSRYERLLMSAMLVGGFLFDFFAFVNIDIVFKFTVLIIYWFLAGVSIIFMQLYDARKISSRFKYVRLFSPLVVQWTFGGLFNISLIFYWFSGAFSVSWPLLAITVALLLFNDSFRHQFSKPLVQIPVYFFITLSLFSLILPFLFASLSPWLFVVAGAASSIIFLVYIYLLPIFIENLRAQRRQLFISVICVAAIMNIFYFTNVIPPIPLALREAEMYHSLTVSGNQYIMRGEPDGLFQELKDAIFGQTLHLTAGERAYLYTSIFAPARLKTTIVDHWQHYDQASKKWVESGKLSFNINGGHKEGYKGYSWQANLAAGKWQVYVENLRGQVLARVRFTVERVDTDVELEKVLK